MHIHYKHTCTCTCVYMYAHTAGYFHLCSSVLSLMQVMVHKSTPPSRQLIFSVLQVNWRNFIGQLIYHISSLISRSVCLGGVNNHNKAFKLHLLHSQREVDKGQKI